MSAPDRPTVLIASYLEPEHVDRIRSVDERLRVVYEPDLLRPPRYPADHTGGPFERTPGQEAAWRRRLAEADVLFDFDQTHREDLPDLAPNVRWIQATSAGIGQFVAGMGYDRRMPGTVFTTASGVHARPLADFCLMACLMFCKGLPRMLADQRAKRWERYAGRDLDGQRLTIVGMGAIGTEIARVARTLGMRVSGVKRSVSGLEPADLCADALYPAAALGAALRGAAFLVLVAPHTPETEGMIGAKELAALPPGAVLINIARGPLVDEAALVEALRSGHLGGACLDVFREEPLPPASPLWELPNVFISPHSGSTTERENERITDLFCDNLRRFLDGAPLTNVLDTARLY